MKQLLAADGGAGQETLPRRRTTLTSRSSSIRKAKKPAATKKKPAAKAKAGAKLSKKSTATTLKKSKPVRSRSRILTVALVTKPRRTIVRRAKPSANECLDVAVMPPETVIVVRDAPPTIGPLPRLISQPTSILARVIKGSQFLKKVFRPFMLLADSKLPPRPSGPIHQLGDAPSIDVETVPEPASEPLQLTDAVAAPGPVPKPVAHQPAQRTSADILTQRLEDNSGPEPDVMHATRLNLKKELAEFVWQHKVADNNMYIMLTPRQLGFTKEPLRWEVVDGKRFAEWSQSCAPRGCVIDYCSSSKALRIVKLGEFKQQPERHVLIVVTKPYCSENGKMPAVHAVERESSRKQWMSEIFVNEPLRLPLDIPCLFMLKPKAKVADKCMSCIASIYGRSSIK